MPRKLQTCTAAVNAITGRSAHVIFGAPDDVKFRLSMTLFARADPRKPEFGAALGAYFDGDEDPRTLDKLAGS